MYEEMEDRIYQHHRLRVLRKRKEYEKYGLVPNYEELRTDPSYSDLRKRVEKEKVIIQAQIDLRSYNMTHTVSHRDYDMRNNMSEFIRHNFWLYMSVDCQ